MTATYKAGTAAVTNGSVNVVGTGTAWAVALVVGGMFSCDGLAVPIAAVVDDTHLTLDYEWPGATGVGKKYSIARENSDAANLVDFHDKLAQLLVDLSIAGIHPDGSGSLAKRDALTLNASNDGYLYLRAELGVAFAFYRWDGPSLAWVGPFPVASATTTAAGVQSIVPGTGIGVNNTNPNIPVIALANMANATIKGRVSAGAGVPEDLTMAQLKSLLLSSVVIREVLTANRTYYVRTDGNDANSGLVNNSGGAFLTVQKAINVVSALDISIYNVGIQVADGTYTGVVAITGPWVGTGTVTITGNATTPSNVVLQTTASANGIIQCSNNGRISLNNVKLTAPNAVGIGLHAFSGGNITWNNVEFGTCANYQMYAEVGSKIQGGGNNVVISGGAQYHVLNAGYVNIVGATVTLTGTPSFSQAFVANSRGGGLIEYYNGSFSGSATGRRYFNTAFGTIFSNGGGASYYPGNTAGTDNALGVYG